MLFRLAYLWYVLVFGAAVAFAPTAAAHDAKLAKDSGNKTSKLTPQQQSVVDIVNSDPLDLKNTLPGDYTNWASLLSHVLLEKEVHERGANKALIHVMELTHQRLMKIADGDLTPPIIALQDDVFMDKAGEKLAIPQTSITGLSTSKVFFNYAPCIFQTSTTGVSAQATGVSITPSLFSFSAGLANIGITGLSFAPSAILVSATGASVQPVGVSVAPALASFNPVGVQVTPGGINIAPQLANIQPTGVNINPQGIAANPVLANYGPVGVGDGAQPDSSTPPQDTLQPQLPEGLGFTGSEKADQPQQSTTERSVPNLGLPLMPLAG